MTGDVPAIHSPLTEVPAYLETLAKKLQSLALSASTTPDGEITEELLRFVASIRDNADIVSDHVWLLRNVMQFQDTLPPRS